MQQKTQKVNNMKKQLIIATSAVLLLSSCGSYNTNEGLYAGATFGHIIGSAIGGITGGPRGHEWGSLIGTIGGAAVGASVGASVDKAQEQKREEARSRRARQRNMQRQSQQNRDYGYNDGYNIGGGSRDDSGYDPQGRGNDIITFDDGNNGYPPSGNNYYNGDTGANRHLGNRPYSSEVLEVRNARIMEAHNDGFLTRGEECRVVFEIMNTSDQTVYDIRPFVEDATGNRHIKISQNLHIESIAPHQGVRYTASILADRSLRNGEIVVRVGVAQGRHVIESQTRTFTVPTAKTH